MEGFTVVEALGHELYLKVQDVSTNYISDMTEVIQKGEFYDAKVMSVDPFKVSIKEAASGKRDLKIYKTVKQWVGTVVGDMVRDGKVTGTFVELPTGHQLLCYKVDRARKLQIGDEVMVEINKINEEKGQLSGFVRRVIKKADFKRK